MSAPNILWAGGEDSELFTVGGGTVDTTANHFRSAFARCGLGLPITSGVFWQNTLPFPSSLTTLWLGARLAMATPNTNSTRSLIQLIDASGFVRLRVRVVATSPTNMGVYKVNTAGTETLLTNTLSTWVFAPSGATTPDQLSINFNNAVSGSVQVYYNGTLVYNFSGDTTTETTAIAALQVFSPGNQTAAWSELVVSDSDTRSMSLQTLAPVANGNTHNFDTGSPAAANINEITLNDATLDGSTTAAQIDQYTIPALATGSFSIVAVGVSARMQKGSSGPSKMDLNVRSGGSDFFSSDLVLTTAWADYQNWWMTDPNTSAAWAALPTNIGLKSIT